MADLLSGDESRAESSLVGIAAAGHLAVPKLLDLQRSPSSDQRWWSIRALAGMESTEADWFIAALGDPAPDVRGAAALALAAHPDVKAIPALIGLLNDEDNVAAVMAVNALVKLGAASVVPLVEAFDATPRRGQVQILRALAELRDPRAIHLLLNAQAEDSAVLQYWAQEGLERLGLNMVYLRPE